MNVFLFESNFTCHLETGHSRRHSNDTYMLGTGMELKTDLFKVQLRSDKCLFLKRLSQVLQSSYVDKTAFCESMASLRLVVHFVIYLRSIAMCNHIESLEQRDLQRLQTRLQASIVGRSHASKMVRRTSSGRVMVLKETRAERDKQTTL